jgi:chorismate synthase
MAHLRFLTAGESHGKALAGILEGVPSGFTINAKDIDSELRRRQGGYGRGGRMQIESDHAELLSGVRSGKTIGSPIAILIENKDWLNWKDVMRVEQRALSRLLTNPKAAAVTRPRPGHADLAGVLKYNQRDIRNILERSSARETAMRVALGAVAKKILSAFDITIGSYVTQIGGQKSDVRGQNLKSKKLLELFKKAEKSPVRCPDAAASKKMVNLIDRTIKQGNSLGGLFEVFVTGVPAGLGSHVHWDRKLDSRLARAVMSIQAIKGVEIGLGFDMGFKQGSEVMDEIYYTAKGKRHRAGFYRKTNNAGGIEGGMSNGMPIIMSAVMKPIPTLKKPLMSVDIETKRAFKAVYERSDTCAVPAAAVVAEAMAALVIADAFLEKFGGDSEKEITRNYKSYSSCINNF